MAAVAIEQCPRRYTQNWGCYLNFDTKIGIPEGKRKGTSKMRTDRWKLS
jgi:hypothetical protein